MSESARKTLLLVEDEAILAMTEKMQLEKYGYAVKTVNTGEKAVEAVKTMPEIDLVLMDINLGDGIDGTQVAEIILKSHDIPIVFVSSHSEREVVEKTEKITSYGYVVKNSSITVLDASIKMAFKLFDAKKKEIEKEKALMLSEEKYRLISENTSDGIIHFSEKGRIDYASPSYLKQLGYLKTEELGRDSDTIASIIHPADRGVVFPSIYDAIEKKNNELTYSFRVKHAKGHYIWREDHAKFLYDVSGKYLGAYVVCRDITERKMTEEALQRSKETAEMLLNVAAEIIISEDFQGNILLLNESGHKILGYESPELIGKNFFDLCLPEEKRSDVKDYFEHLKSGKPDIPVTHENEVLTKTGDRKTILWYNLILKNKDEEYIGLFSSGKDITEQKIAEKKLQENVDKFDLLLHSVAEGIYGVDEHENFTYCNYSALKMLGYAHQEQLLGKNMHWLIHGKHPDGSVYPIEDCPIVQDLKEGIGVHIDDEVFWRSDGTYFPVEYWFNPQIQNGKVIGGVMSFVDISERK
jgi:PAS domain S-box-containing protein